MASWTRNSDNQNWTPTRAQRSNHKRNAKIFNIFELLISLQMMIQISLAIWPSSSKLLLEPLHFLTIDDIQEKNTLSRCYVVFNPNMAT